MKGHEDIRELAAIYPLGTLDDEERESLESHLASGCEECESAVREARKTIDDLAHAIEPVAPSATVRERLLARVRQDVKQSASGHRSGLHFVVHQLRHWVRTNEIHDLTQDSLGEPSFVGHQRHAQDRVLMRILRL